MLAIDVGDRIFQTRMASKSQTVKDLIEEAKKRTLLLCICVIGLAYLMSLTSSSVWINMPAAVFVIVLIRYISYDVSARRKIAEQGTPSSTKNILQNQMTHGNASFQPQSEPTDWRRKVDSPIVEAAIDKLTRHLVSEWITNLWYEKITPDKDAPEELTEIMNGILGEICLRAKDVNLIELVTRDTIQLVCEHIELYRIIQTHIGEAMLSSLSNDERDAKLKLTLAEDNKLHPALFSAEAEHKVLQRFMDGVMNLTCKPDDLQCKFFRYIARELLACAVMRPIINLASPKFINERIETAVLSLRNRDGKLSKASETGTKQSKSSRSRFTPDHFSGFLDRSISGVELVQLGHSHGKKSQPVEFDEAQNGVSSSFQNEPKNAYLGPSAGIHPKNHIVQYYQQEGDTSNIVPDIWKSQSENVEGMEKHNVDGKTTQARRSSGGEWAQMLDIMSRRKNETLAPENIENRWAKGRNYKKKEIAKCASKPSNPRVLSEASDKTNFVRKPFNGQPKNSGIIKSSVSENHPSFSPQIKQSSGDSSRELEDASRLEEPSHVHEQIRHEKSFKQHMEIIEESGSSYTSEDDENSSVTGLGTPGIKVWDSKSNRAGSVSHHPLENDQGHHTKQGNKSQLRYRKLYKTASGRRRTRSRQGVDSWQELERTSFYLRDGLDILNTAQAEDMRTEDQGDEGESESRVSSGTLACSSAASICSSETINSSKINSERSHLAVASPSQQLRCKVLGANFVKSDSKTIAVYSISVTDNDNHTWSIKRRFRHFEELHRRLKDFTEYSLSLPPKRFLSSSLDSSVVYERCNLLDKYLKDLLILPNVAESIEVWDFLSVDSQTYMFSSPLSMIETLSVDLDNKQYGKHAKFNENNTKNTKESLDWSRDKSAVRYIECDSNLATSPSAEESRQHGRDTEQEPSFYKNKQHEGMSVSYSESDSDVDQHRGKIRLKISEKSRNKARAEVNILNDASDVLSVEDDSMVPSEWIPPNLSVPILNLVDVIFQLQDGGWIRRQAFWVAKQVLQLGMGDAFDDWLIEKVQLLRKGEVVASAISKIEQILWPDGIFLTKHPRHQRRTTSSKGDPSASHIPSSSSKGDPSAAHITPSSSKGASHITETATSPKEVEHGKHEEKDNQSLLDQQMEEARRAKFVRELMIDNAPAALVGLVGRKEYERCARDIYFFLQSAVCLKQLAYGLVEMLLLAAFPELRDIVSSCHTEKGSFEVI